jgi:hypothetical protein
MLNPSLNIRNLKAFLYFGLFIVGLLLPISVQAAANLTITPITWNVMGLDSNNVNEGPNIFPVGVRVCNTGDATGINVTPTFVWDSTNTNINLVPGSLGDTYSATPRPYKPPESLAAGDCFDFYFDVEITRTSAAYNTARGYHITVTADGGISVSTPTPREIYVEKIQSQSRNGVIQLYLDGVLIPAGGTMNMEVGKEYTITLTASTATQGYEQLQAFIGLPNTIFQIVPVIPYSGDTTGILSDYSANTSPFIQGGSKPVSDFHGMYADACGWINNPADPNYMKKPCQFSYKTGGDVVVEYRVGIIDLAPTGTTNIYSLIQDFSGSSYNYNSDYDDEFRIVNILPTHVLISDFYAYEDGDKVVIHWETSSERNTYGFLLFRLDKSTGKYQQLNSGVLPGVLRPPYGGVYELTDPGASPGGTYTYKIVEIEMNGSRLTYGPYTVTVGTKGTSTFDESVSKSLGNGVGRTLEDESLQYVRQIRKEFTNNERRKAHKTSLGGRNVSKPQPSTSNRIKIPVVDSGVYYVSASTLSSAFGIPPDKVPLLIVRGQLSVSTLGKQVAYLPAPNNTGLYFYATKIDSIFASENIYWIDIGNGTIMNTIKEKSPSSTGSGSFASQLHLEQEVFPFVSVTNDPNADYWFWDDLCNGIYCSTSEKEFKFLAESIASSGNATLQANLRGASPLSYTPRHNAVVFLNNVRIGEGIWTGLDAYTITATFDQSLLQEGENTIKIQNVIGPDVTESYFLIDSFDLTYKRLYKAAKEELLFSGDGNPIVTVTGFTSPDIMVFDITNPLLPKILKNVSVNNTIGMASFVPATASTPYYAVSGSGLRTAVSEATPPPSLALSGNTADYIIIAPRDFASTAQGLADYRSGQGLQSMVVRLEDVMNEFNYGISSPYAIRNFLSYAYSSWRKAPKYLLLAGDGSMDYKDNMGLGGNLIPPLMAPTPYGLFATDTALADINSDHVPEIAIGRLPVLDGSELLTVINKIKTYESPSSTSSNVTILAPDNPDGAGDFTANSEAVAEIFPAGYSLTKIYLEDPLLVDPKGTLLSAINSGAAYFNYIGHASPIVLAEESLLMYYPWDPAFDDLQYLVNADSLPVMTAMTCSVGDYSIPGLTTLSEALLLKPDGGMAAIWSPTGLSEDWLGAILNREFYKAIFTGGKQILGDVVQSALRIYKTSGSQPFMMDIYNILGDPAMHLR